MPTLFADVAITSIAEFVALFADGGVLRSPSTRWYRGEGKLRKRNALIPSIARPPHSLAHEWKIYQLFRQNGAAFLSHLNLSEWDWMLYMRHYGAPTRLLDWSESPLVALYFAVEKKSRDKNEGAVWCLDPERLNELAGLERRVFCAGIDEELSAYTVDGLRKSPIAAKFKPAALIAARSFPRLIAQQGVFTVVHREATALERISDPSLLACVRIPQKAKSVIRSELRGLGFNRLAMFPELQSVSDRI